MRRSGVLLFSCSIMDDLRNTIGLTALLDEVDHDLAELRKKHASDYGVKTITMWWELERERLMARHNPATEIQKLRRAHGLKRMLLGFSAGWVTLLALNAALRFWVP